MFRNKQEYHVKLMIIIYVLAIVNEIIVETLVFCQWNIKLSPTYIRRPARIKRSLWTNNLKDLPYDRRPPSIVDMQKHTIRPEEFYYNEERLILTKFMGLVNEKWSSSPLSICYT